MASRAASGAVIQTIGSRLDFELQEGAAFLFFLHHLPNSFLSFREVLQIEREVLSSGTRECALRKFGQFT
jgi:hypothetical protein